MSIKTLTFLTGIMLTNMASSECYVKSNSLSEFKHPIDQIDKLQQYPIKLSNGQVKCSVTFNALIDGKWYPADADVIGSGDENKVCAQAIQAGRVAILKETSNIKLTVNEEMSCTDVPIPKTRVVKIGEVVRLSEVTPHPLHKQIKKDKSGDEYFWFVEDFQEIGNTKRINGMLRRVNETDWRVVDKW